MSIVQQLKEPSQLPDGLKALMAELQVPINDPVIPLLLWIWQQMTETKLVLDNARASTQAVFDNRLERLSKLAELMLSMEIALKEVRKTLETKPLQIKEQVEKELAAPLSIVVSCMSRCCSRNNFGILIAPLIRWCEGRMSISLSALTSLIQCFWRKTERIALITIKSLGASFTRQLLGYIARRYCAWDGLPKSYESLP